MNTLAVLYNLQLIHSQILLNSSVITSANSTTSLASGTYPLIEYLKLYARDKPEFQDIAEIQLQTFTMMKHITPPSSQYRLRNLFFHKKMENLELAVRRVEDLFSDYVLLKKNFNKSVNMSRYLNATYENYLYKVYRAGFYGITEMIDTIYDILAPRFESAQEYPLIASVLDLEKSCYARISRMQMLGQLLGHLAVIEAKCFLIINLGYDIKSLLYQDDFSEEKRLAENKSIDRHNRVIRKLKPQLINLSNAVHTCDPQVHIKGLTYLELEGLFQTYLAHEADFEIPGTCSEDCSQITGMRACVYEVFGVNNPKSFCNVTHRCSTDLKACKPLLDNNHYSPNPKVCISPKWKPERRYDFISFHNNAAMQYCNGHLEEASKSVNYIVFSAYKCIFCQCTCAQGNYKKAEYKFSLMSSNVLFEQNYVMTNARFVRRNDVIHIQVQQGKLLPYGGIDPSSIEWRSLPKEDKAQEITWKIREVELCSLKVPDGHIVVGVSLFLRDEKQFGLRVMHLPFNFSNGLLMKDDVPQVMFIDYNKKASTQSELYLSNKDVPTRTYDNDVHSYDHQYLRFQPSDLENDGGQSTIPFIDMQEVNFTIPTPLSGVGLTHRYNALTTLTSGGFLGLKLFTYNFTSHLDEILISDEAIVPSIIHN